MFKKKNKSSTGKPWKQFEKLVAKIEESLCPKGAIVTLDDKVEDIRHGVMRQVDATIRYKIGSVDIFIAIECRKRESKQDARWIEELNTKKMNIGADKIIAVSSAGFSEYAFKMAKGYGISLRKIDKINPDRLLDEYLLKIIETRYTTETLELKFSSINSQQLAFINQENVNNGVFDTNKKILYHDKSSDPLSIFQLYNPFFEKMMNENKISTEHDSMKMLLEVPKNMYHTNTPHGKIHLEKLQITFRHIEKSTELNRYSKYNYLDENNTKINETIEFEHEFVDGKIDLLYYDTSQFNS